MDPVVPEAAPPAPATLPLPASTPFATWLKEGLRAGIFLRPRLAAGTRPGPRDLLGLLCITILVDLLLGRLEVPGEATFNTALWLAPWWATGALVLLLWALLPPVDGRAAAGDAGRGRPAGLAAWFALWFGAVLPGSVVALLLGAAHAHGWIPARVAQSGWFAWGAYLGLWAWTLGAATRLGHHFGLDRRRQGCLALGLLLVFGASAWLFPDKPWQAVASDAGEERPRLVLNQEAFEAQAAAWQHAVAGLAPQRPGIVDVYGLVFAPYADEDVFLRESTMVAGVLAGRFDAQGRVLHLVNNVATAATHPWATSLNLRRGVEAIAQRMDPQEDVLVVYLTSHGASNFRLAASHGALDVEPISPGELREALDAAGIRQRVIAVSACYSGGWVGPLADDGTLVMTAADATHTSYGCGRLSELTFFGRAVFDEQLRRTRSFEKAFAAAVPLIRQRELEAGKADGFSNPQISVGARIRTVLEGVEARLDGP